MEQVGTKQESQGKTKMIDCNYAVSIVSRRMKVDEQGLLKEHLINTVDKAIEGFQTKYEGGVITHVQADGYSMIVYGRRPETPTEKKSRLAQEKRVREFKKNNEEREKEQDMQTYERIKKKYNL